MTFAINYYRQSENYTKKIFIQDLETNLDDTNSRLSIDMAKVFRQGGNCVTLNSKNIGQRQINFLIGRLITNKTQEIQDINKHLKEKYGEAGYEVRPLAYQPGYHETYLCWKYGQHNTDSLHTK
jgi:predicted acetyltransferase